MPSSRVLHNPFYQDCQRRSNSEREENRRNTETASSVYYDARLFLLSAHGCPCSMTPLAHDIFLRMSGESGGAAHLFVVRV